MNAARALVRAAAALTFTVILTACGSSPASEGPTSGPDPTETQTSPTQSGPSAVWLAGLRVEADSEDLNADTQKILEAAGTAIFTGPVSCFDSVPAEFVPAPDAYVLGLVAPSREELEVAVDRVGREPIFVVQVTNTCVD